VLEVWREDVQCGMRDGACCRQVLEVLRLRVDGRSLLSVILVLVF
jgi:hypothetical protein